YNLVMSKVLDDFPTLRIVVSHGGGAIPYQLGRFEAATLRSSQRFSERMRRLFFDTVLYTRPALEFLFKTVGPDRCLFGEECPGVGSGLDPRTGRTLDDIRPHIEDMDFLSAAEKRLIFEENARAVFKLPAGVAAS
ncbi:MAG: amidohydrolase, partial [Actinobacteria bacterium]|nr:amidohydrolase [Actinomycetota bacterium]